MSKQLELDINCPSWADTDFRSEIKDLWSVRKNNSPAQNTNESVLDGLGIYAESHSERQTTTK
ncbi:MAG: hypothetical protein ACI8PV_001795 [Dinoroseobacter sp.]|jgi:hypothetical protein